MTRRRMTWKHRLFRLLGIVSPSGAYPLPPRWAMSRLGKARWYGHPSTADEQRTAEAAYTVDVLAGLRAKGALYAGPVLAIGDRSVAAGGSIGVVHTDRCACVQACICGPVTGDMPPGALTRFSTGDAQHVHGRTSSGICGPGGDVGVSCFTERPYGRQEGVQGC